MFNFEIKEALGGIINYIYIKRFKYLLTRTQGWIQDLREAWAKISGRGGLKEKKCCCREELNLQPKAISRKQPLTITINPNNYIYSQISSCIFFQGWAGAPLAPLDPPLQEQHKSRRASFVELKHEIFSKFEELPLPTILTHLFYLFFQG